MLNLWRLFDRLTKAFKEAPTMRSRIVLAAVLIALILGIVGACVLGYKSPGQTGTFEVGENPSPAAQISTPPEPTSIPEPKVK